MKHSSERMRREHPVLRFIGRFFAVLGVTLLAAALLLTGALALICRGPSPTARDLFVTTAQQNELLKPLAGLFLSDAQITAILNENRLMPAGSVTDTTFGFIESADPDADPIELVEIKGASYTGKLLIVRDPSRMELSCLSAFDENGTGASAEHFAKQSEAIAAMCSGMGGVPTGFVIQDGKLIFSNSTDNATAFSVIAFDWSNRLIVGPMTVEKAMTEADNMGIRNAICADSAAIIVNGEAVEIAGLGDGIHPRAVIGQRADGAILMMVLDGVKQTAPGVLLEDCIREMLNRGAVNAAILDSSDSAALVYQNKLLNETVDAQDRCAPVAFVVK